MGIVTEIIDALTAWLSGFLEVITDGLTSVVDIFYTSGAEGGLTVIGALAVMGLAIGLVSLVIAFVRGLIQR